MEKYIRIIIMASGLSRRYGENKLLVKVNQKPMYYPVLENVSAFLKKYPGQAVGIVVSSYEEILRYGEKLGLKTIKNRKPEIGQSESIKLGLSYPVEKNREQGEAAVFLTADQPFMTAKTLEVFLVEAMKTKAGFLCASFHGEPGNPVSFDEKYYDELMTLEGDEGGKRVMKKHLTQVDYIEINKNELRDIDRPEDLR